MEDKFFTREERTIHSSDSYLIRNRLETLKKREKFWGFDWFLLRKWGENCANEDFEKYSEEELNKLRKKACKKMNKVIRGKGVADYHTIRLWFGIGGLAKPNRKHVFLLAFALGLSVEETQDYLVNGMLVPEIQVNDYEEFIYMYGLENKLGFAVCQKMIGIFERTMYGKMVVEQKTHTEKLKAMYCNQVNKSPDDFLIWMCENAGMFKGYSKTCLNYFVSLKTEIIGILRQEAKEGLLEMLEETTFFTWAKENKIGEKDYKEAIYRYIRNEVRRKGSAISIEEAQALRDYYKIAYGDKDKNADLLSELYAAAMVTDRKGSVRYKKRESYNLPTSIRFMTDKYLSQLLSVGEQKEREIALSQELAVLSNGAETQKNEKKIKEIKSKLSGQQQRCHLIERDDLLPFIHYVAQKRYYSLIQGNMDAYDYREARHFFETLANVTLSSCNMAPVSPKYELDYLLLSCYCKNDMYSISDMIEEAERDDMGGAR